MAFLRKTWKDRITEYPTRRKLKKADNTTELVTVTREEGTVSEEGDAFNAENMNNLEERVGEEFDALNAYLTSAELFRIADTVKAGISIEAGQSLAYSLELKQIDGYTPIALTGFALPSLDYFQTSHIRLSPQNGTIGANKVDFNIKNTSTSTRTARVQVTMLYIKTK